MTTQHTPGPWAADIFGGQVLINSQSAEKSSSISLWKGTAIANLYGFPQFGASVDKSNEMMLANARLIAAAPDLLEALTKAEETLGENLVWIADQADLGVRQKDPETLRRLKQLADGWKDILKAIAKAKGEEQR